MHRAPATLELTIELLLTKPSRRHNCVDVASITHRCPACDARRGSPCSWASPRADVSWCAHPSRRALSAERLLPALLEATPATPASSRKVLLFVVAEVTRATEARELLIGHGLAAVVIDVGDGEPLRVVAAAAACVMREAAVPTTLAPVTGAKADALASVAPLAPVVERAPERLIDRHASLSSRAAAAAAEDTSPSCAPRARHA